MKLKTEIAAVIAMALFAFATAPNPANADGPHSEAIGEPGSADAVDRTITIKMADNEFEPEFVDVSAGETIRFVIENAGEFVHEFNIGTHDMHASHQQEMLVMMEMGVLEIDRINHQMMAEAGMMSHDDPNALLLEPGQSGEVIWKFAANDTLQFGCNVPGHYEGGMVGEFRLN